MTPSASTPTLPLPAPLPANRRGHWRAGSQWEAAAGGRGGVSRRPRGGRHDGQPQREVRESGAGCTGIWRGHIEGYRRSWRVIWGVYSGVGRVWACLEGYGGYRGVWRGMWWFGGVCGGLEGYMGHIGGVWRGIWGVWGLEGCLGGYRGCLERNMGVNGTYRGCLEGYMGAVGVSRGGIWDM